MNKWKLWLIPLLFFACSGHLEREWNRSQRAREPKGKRADSQYPSG